MNGIINVYKEKGFTSHDVVAKLRGILKMRKIGHTGTLDPNAEGVLPVCLGSATKLCDMLTEKQKEYQAEMILGIRTDTDDITGEVIEKKEDWDITENFLEETILSFVGESYQIPPMYSARKINGKKLYEIAREGKVIERPAKKVMIYEIRDIKINLPHVYFTVRCGAGTYIRSLCRDIGEKIGCGACMGELKRTKVSAFEISKSFRLSEIEEMMKAGNISDAVLPVEKVFKNLSKIMTQKNGDRFLYNGNMFEKRNLKDSNGIYKHGQLLRVYDSSNEFKAIYQYDKEKNKFVPYKMFL